MRHLTVCAGMVLLMSAAHAAPVAVTCGWARASLPHQDTAVAYLTLLSQAGDTLTGVDAEEAGMVMLHQTSSQGGVAQMKDLDSLALPAGKKVVLAPRGTHLMLMDLPRTLKAGGTLHLALHLAKAGIVKADLPILGLSAAGPCS